MRRPQRLIAATVLIALSGALAGCGSMGNFDPSDLLDFLDTKKKLPGERKPVFPEGVPGLEQGVPKDLYKGARQDDPNAQAAAAPPPAEEPKAKRGAKGKGKQAAAPAAAPADPDAAPEEEGATAAAPPAPKPAKITRKRTTAPPPDQSAAPAQSSQQSAFPAPMPSGSFTR
jgi:predicted small lipoprotein YifL